MVDLIRRCLGLVSDSWLLSSVSPSQVSTRLVRGRQQETTNKVQEEDGPTVCALHAEPRCEPRTGYRSAVTLRHCRDELLTLARFCYVFLARSCGGPLGALFFFFSFPFCFSFSSFGELSACHGSNLLLRVVRSQQLTSRSHDVGLFGAVPESLGSL